MAKNITTLLTNQAPVVQKLDSAILLLNKWGQVNNQSITINWRDAIHFDSEDDYCTGLETSVTINRSTFAQTIIFYPLMKLSV